MLKKFLVFIFISFLLAGCTSDKIDISMNNGNVRAIRDYEGTIVELPEKPKRILTLSLGFDVMTLGLVPPDRLVAVHKQRRILAFPG
ncbi:ABC transporter substrate-binding protein [Phascolarctobacterium faecium]|uniref:ABC transporter substrate-binding protein n=1 Tax=Phascolarctobacterium faecium TaxID=33025 RepID=UPI0016598D71|nr:ABC transporter substrate-binding protein [Phascolarctobacterium faecium]QNP76704.1 ABC transporter substrate-binding protein [Phascolarctobacterium faecium]